MKKIILACLLVPMLAMAGLSYQDEETGVKVVGSDHKCSNADVLTFIKLINGADQYVWKDAVVTVNGQIIHACWAVLPSGTPVIVDEVGGAGQLSGAEVK